VLREWNFAAQCE
jgi:hypothetical protein